MSTKRTANGQKPRQSRRRAAFIRKRVTPRVRDLFDDLMAGRTNAGGAYLESQVLKVVELTVAAESLRAELDAMLAGAKGKPLADAEVKSLAALINSVTRLESTARRASADLGKVAPAEDDPYSEFLRLQEEEEAQRAQRVAAAAKESK